MLCMMVSKLGLSSEEEGGGVVVYTTWPTSIATLALKK